MQLDALGGGFAVRKKGVIDLVTEVDLAIERMFRELVAERYPDHDVLGEELGPPDAGRPPARHCWIVDPIDGTTNFAHGLPIFCASLALEIDGAVDARRGIRPDARRAVHGRARARSLAERRTRSACRPTIASSIRCSSPAFHTRCTNEARGDAGPVRRLHLGSRARCGGSGRRRSTSATWPPDAWRGSGSGASGTWDIAAAALLVEEAGGRVSDLDGGPFVLRTGRLLASNGRVHDEMLATIAGYAAERARKRTL